MWAVSSLDPLASGAFAQHDAAATAGPVNLLSSPLGPISDATSRDSRRRAHGVLMLLAWLLFAVYGTFVARYLKALGPMWMYATQSLSDLLTYF